MYLNFNMLAVSIERIVKGDVGISSSHDAEKTFFVSAERIANILAVSRILNE